jgi:hypothetical protein
MKLKNLPLLLIVAALLVVPAGCIFSPDNGEDPEPTNNDLPPATTREKLMINFETIYTEMRFDDFQDMLHEDYKTILLSDTLEEWGWADDYYFDRTIELDIHRKMFGGQTGLDSNGNIIHPIDSILVDVLELQGTWEKIPEDDLYFGGYDGWWGHYRVELQFKDADNSHRFVVQQAVNFFVAPVDVNGRDIWVMLGQRGLPLLK